VWCRVLDYREYKIFEDEEPNLKDSSSIDDGVIISGHLNPFHLFERLHNAEIFTVDGTKCRYVDIVILEGLQIENFYVLSIKPHQKFEKVQIRHYKAFSYHGPLEHGCKKKLLQMS
jgi:hypothetical protein